MKLVMLKNLIWMQKMFYDMLDATIQPIYVGCREGLSKWSLVTRMMNIKLIIIYLIIAWIHEVSCLKSIC